MSNNPKKRYILLADFALTKGEKGDTGATGAAGAGADLPINTSDSVHNGTERAGENLRDIIDSLSYVALAINSFTTSVLKYERGTVLTSIALTWSLNKTIASQTITGAFVVPPTLIASQRAATVTLSNANTNFSITLDVNDGSGNATASRSITTSFIDPIYYGKAGIPGAVNDAFLNSTLSSILQSSRALTFSEDLGAGEYLWYALPTSLLNGGTPIFKMNGFTSSMTFIDDFSHTNGSGGTPINYTVYRTEYAELGFTEIEVI
jgi:hypothetical protein